MPGALAESCPKSAAILRLGATDHLLPSPDIHRLHPGGGEPVPGAPLHRGAGTAVPQAPRGRLPPHIFAIANSCYFNMKKSRGTSAASSGEVLGGPPTISEHLITEGASPFQSLSDQHAT